MCLSLNLFPEMLSVTPLQTQKVEVVQDDLNNLLRTTPPGASTFLHRQGSPESMLLNKIPLNLQNN